MQGSSNSNRYATFNINKGLRKIIGRASLHSNKRFPCVDNFYYMEKSLSRSHCLICVKKLNNIDSFDPLDIIENIRIYVEDLNSTYGIVDLQSENNMNPKTIDLKNGETFGLVSLEGRFLNEDDNYVKLKLQVLLFPMETDINMWTLQLNDVTLMEPLYYDKTINKYLKMLKVEDMRDSNIRFSYTNPLREEENCIESTSRSNGRNIQLYENFGYETTRLPQNNTKKNLGLSVVTRIKSTIRKREITHRFNDANVNICRGDSSQSYNLVSLKSSYLRFPDSNNFSVLKNRGVLYSFPVTSMKTDIETRKRTMPFEDVSNDRLEIIHTEAPMKKKIKTAKSSNKFTGNLFLEIYNDVEISKLAKGFMLGSVCTLALLTIIANR